jgi:5'-3' exonuclease
MGQCVKGNRVVQFDRRNDVIINEDAVRAKFGVGPTSIADWLGLVGDTADGFPGLQGWGAKSASAVLAVYQHIEDIPDDVDSWSEAARGVRGAAKLAATLCDNREMAMLFKDIATVRTDVADDVDIGTVDSWRWRGPTSALETFAKELGIAQLVERVERATVGRD